MAKKSKGLGRGLGALLNTDEAVKIENPQGSDDKGILELKISEVEPNKTQPRSHFDDDALKSLSESIKEYGVLSPIVVSKNENGFYMIIAGERRWRAAKLAGLKKIPAIIKEYDDKQTMEIALIENLQREDLNPIEEAEGFKELMEVYNLTQEEVSKKMGKSRSAVANSVRLLSLPEKVRKMLINKEISSGHARAILSLNDEKVMLSVAEKIINEGLNVRQTENIVSKLLKEPKKKEINKNDEELLRYLSSLEKNLGSHLGTKVKIHHGKSKGKIEIEYYSNEDFERIMNIIR